MSLKNIVQRTLAQKCAVTVVVDDGCTDCSIKTLLTGLPVTLLTHPYNRGKGASLQTAVEYLVHSLPHIKWMITLDADGQHFPEDVPLFLSVIKEKDREKAFFIGARDFCREKNIPSFSVAGRFLSNFFIQLETAQKLADTQSGFRCYPLALLHTLKKCSSSGYGWETESLVYAAWAGAEIFHLPIKVEYFTRKTRVSHFKFFKDNFYIFLLHLKLLFILLYNKIKK